MISDSGTFTSLKVVTSAAGAPTFLIVHAALRLSEASETFTLENQIKETVTADPNVFMGAGTWVIRSGTGAYADLHGQGEIAGVTDENADPDLFIRTYTGTGHLD